jgi:hypothetical protein
MRATDKAEFLKLLTQCYSAAQKPLPTFDVIDLWLTLLKPYTLAQVSAALSAHMRESRFAPMPADVITRITTSDERPEADEAWAIALAARDERETVVWTDEAARAWEIVRDLCESDETGARFAFRSAYTRLCSEARARAVPVHWRVSTGHDAARREQVITEAVNTGRLAIEAVRVNVPALAAPAEPAGDGVDAAAARAQLRELVAAIRAGQMRRAAERERNARLDQAATLTRKRELAAQAERS